MNESAASTTLKRIALFKVNKVPYLLEFNINWAAATHLTRVWSRWDELGKQAVGQTTVRKGRGNSTVSNSIFFIFFSTYKIILGIHTYIFHNREWFLLGGTTLGWGGTCPLRPPRDLRPWMGEWCWSFFDPLPPSSLSSPVYLSILSSFLWLHCPNLPFSCRRQCQLLHQITLLGSVCRWGTV